MPVGWHTFAINFNTREWEALKAESERQGIPVSRLLRYYCFNAEHCKFPEVEQQDLEKAKRGVL